MSFTLSDRVLRRLCEINSFAVPNSELVFFGLRGCLAVNPDEHQFGPQHALEVVACDYIHPRCVLGQWRPEARTLAVFPGSTVPHAKYVKTSVEQDGSGTNQVMSGFYQDYRKGVHKNGKPTGHDAFRQTEGHPIRRTSDDFDFDNDDRVEFMNPYDNIHAAWSMGVNHNEYASAGCQVVVGFPKCESRGVKPDAGAWKTFKANAYKISQSQFGYILLSSLDAQMVAQAGSQKLQAKLRFGSSGSLVTKVQKRLKTKGFYEGEIAGNFELRTCRAVLECQTAMFGPRADDGIVGPMTAEALGVAWPAL